jgi:uncharacterized membrane protein
MTRHKTLVTGLTHQKWAGQEKFVCLFVFFFFCSVRLYFLRFTKLANGDLLHKYNQLCAFISIIFHKKESSITFWQPFFIFCSPIQILLSFLSSHKWSKDKK